MGPLEAAAKGGCNVFGGLALWALSWTNITCQPITMWNITFIPCLVSCPMTDSLHIVCVCLQSTTPPLMNLCPTNRREVQTNMQSATDQWESRTRGSQWPPQQTILVADDILFYRQWLPVPFSDCHCWLIPFVWLRSYCPPPCSDNRDTEKNVRVRRRSIT